MRHLSHMNVRYNLNANWFNMDISLCSQHKTGDTSAFIYLKFTSPMLKTGIYPQVWDSKHCTIAKHFNTCSWIQPWWIKKILMLESSTKITEGNNTVSPLVLPPTPFCNVYIDLKRVKLFRTLPTLLFLSPLMFICHIHTRSVIYFTGHYLPLWLEVPLPSPTMELLTCHPLLIPPNMPTTHQSPTGVTDFLLLPSQRALGSSTDLRSPPGAGNSSSPTGPPPTTSHCRPVYELGCSGGYQYQHKGSKTK